MILDSGERREFETGAVRDIQEGKGRCDLLPLDIVANYMSDEIILNIWKFTDANQTSYLKKALDLFATKHYNNDFCTLLLEVSKHFEEGCNKYGDDNWQKGIPTKCYIDSAVRHYLKHFRGDDDEPHDRAFCWNLLCCWWTCVHIPGMNSYKKVSFVSGTAELNRISNSDKSSYIPPTIDTHSTYSATNMDTFWEDLKRQQDEEDSQY